MPCIPCSIEHGMRSARERNAMRRCNMDKELAILAARMPNFAEILSKAAREGRVTGYTPPTKIIWPAGEIYTHLARGDVLHGLDLAHEIRRELGQEEYAMTPLQILLSAVRP